MNTDRHNYEIEYLLEFFSQNKPKLEALGIVIERDDLLTHWEKLDIYRPYNNAMHMLMVNFFQEAKDEFKKFLAQDSSLKSRLVYSLIIFSALVHIDLVNPLVYYKYRIKNFFSRVF